MVENMCHMGENLSAPKWAEKPGGCSCEQGILLFFQEHNFWTQYVPKSRKYGPKSLFFGNLCAIVCPIIKIFKFKILIRPSRIFP